MFRSRAICGALIWLALITPAWGDQRQAVELLLRARQIAPDIDNQEQSDFLLGEIAQDLAKLGETPLARETFALIVGDDERDYAQKPFLESQLQAKDFFEAQRTVESMKTPQGRAEALCSMASAQWEAGKRNAARRALSKALETFAQHRAELTNAVFLEQLAQTQDELGDAAGAKRIRRALTKISGGYGIAADDFGSASTFNSESGKLRTAGRAETQKGDLDAARSTLLRAADSIETVPDAGNRAILLYMIAIDQANAGDLNGARTSFSQAVDRALVLPEGLHRNLIIRDIAREQASAGDIEGSLLTASKISDAKLSDQALHGIAVSEVTQVGLESGLMTASKIQATEEYDMTLVDAAQYLGKEQDASKVSYVVDKIHSPYMKALGFIEAAEAMVQK
jgi:tetratricopeptide (TPR) repeat protein